MASSKGYFGRASYRFLSGDRDSLSHSLAATDSDSVFEFDESDIYNSSRANSSPEFRKSLRLAKKPSSSKLADSGGRVGAPASLPVNIPDWSKILGDEYRDNRKSIDDCDYDEAESDDGCDESEKNGGSGRVPPHEFLARRTRIASLSVHEGVGRTLKGRDLSRVRNAIWAKTGFQD